MAARDKAAKRLPDGTVTLFFADVEGSTRLLHTLGERFAPARARMRELVRAAARNHGGQEVDWAGDGAFLVFAGARDAVAAAAELQAALAREPWPPEEALFLRIGIHTGEPALGDEGYVGLDVHVAARICAAAHGGQVVVSRTTWNVIGEEPFGGASFVPLGRHRLKDVPEPVQLFQLVAPSLAESFPPLQTLGGATLPALHHRLVGRDEDVRAIQILLAHPGIRLVTITGPGGAGKSRLALEVAGEAAVERPVHLVGLASISDPALVPAAIARTLGVKESSEHSLLEGVSRALTGTGALLVLDNLEHLPGAAHDLRSLLDHAPDVKLLTTSRVPLNLSGEHVLPLQPLRVEPASELFAELAAARGVLLGKGALPAVREICRRLDGLPLAIELVAARLVVLPPAQVLAALDDGLALDMEGPVDLPERQRTLRATIEWSYDLLNERQRKLHCTLAVFAGGCTLDDARALADGGAQFLGDLESLVAWSLLRSDVADGNVRLSMLETVREHAIARLASEGSLEELRRRHAERVFELALAAEQELSGPDQAMWLERLERELDNIRAALDWFVTCGRVEDALRTISALGRFWRAHAHVTEARRWFALGLELAHGAPAEVRAAALHTAAQQALAQSDWDGAEPLFEEAVELFRECGRGADQSMDVGYLSFIALRRDETQRAEELAKQALDIAREVDDARATAFALMALGDAAWSRGAHDRALARYEEAVELCRRLGDPLFFTNAVYNLGMTAYQGGGLARAREAFEEALVLARDLEDAPHIAAAQFMLAELDILAGDGSGAEGRARESLALYTDLGDDRSRARCLVILAGARSVAGSFEDAARLVGAAEALRGGDTPDSFEVSILERYASQLEEALGTDRILDLKAEGARMAPDALTGQVVSPAIAE